MPLCQECGRQVDYEELVAGPPAAQVTGPGSPAAQVAGTGTPDPESRDRCPTCGTVLSHEDDSDDEEAHVKAPWHFKVLVVGTVVYLGYRLYQGIGWLIHHG